MNFLSKSFWEVIHNVHVLFSCVWLLLCLQLEVWQVKKGRLTTTIFWSIRQMHTLDGLHGLLRTRASIIAVKELGQILRLPFDRLGEHLEVHVEATVLGGEIKVWGREERPLVSKLTIRFMRGNQIYRSLRHVRKRDIWDNLVFIRVSKSVKVRSLFCLKVDLYNPPLQIVLIRHKVKDRGFSQPFFSQLLFFFPALLCDVSLDLHAYVVKQWLQVDNNVH